MSIRSLMNYLYPRLLALHDLDDQTALPDETGRTKFPSGMRAGHFFMEANGIYLIGVSCSPCLNRTSRSKSCNVILDNDETMIFWIGASVSPQLIQDLFGIDDIMALDSHTVSSPLLHAGYALTPVDC